MQKKWLYLLILACCMTGGIWVACNSINYASASSHNMVSVCLFKAATGLPCPSCGSTKSVVDITRMHFADALYANPIGFIVAILLVILPFWIVADLATHKQSFYNFYNAAELIIRKRWVAISLILLVAANWAWNIYKYTS